MTMTIVAANIVHAFTVSFISLFDALVVFLNLLICYIETYILVALTKRKIIDRNCVRTCEIMNDTFRSCNTCMANHGQDPRYSW